MDMPNHCLGEDRSKWAMHAPILAVLHEQDLLAPMTRHRDAHPAAWVEPANTAKPACAALSVIATSKRHLWGA